MSQPLAIDTPAPIQTAIDDLEGEINLDDFVLVNFKNPAPGLQAYQLRPTASYQKKVIRIGSLFVDEFRPQIRQRYPQPRQISWYPSLIYLKQGRIGHKMGAVGSIRSEKGGSKISFTTEGKDEAERKAWFYESKSKLFLFNEDINVGGDELVFILVRIEPDEPEVGTDTKSKAIP